MTPAGERTPPMPKILWLVSITLPEAAAACGLSAAEVGGGWLTGMLDALAPAVDLTVCSLDARTSQPLRRSRDGAAFVVLPVGSGFDGLLEEGGFDLVHIWGTEYPAAAAMQDAARRHGLPVLVGIQGVMKDCAAHLCDGVPERYLHSCAVQRFIDRVVPGALLDAMQGRFDALAQSEASLLAGARHVTGRTTFDRRAVSELAPQAAYYPCNETLRPVFVNSRELWHPREFGRGPVLLMSQGNYPLKNLHTLLRAMPAVLRRWPDAVLRVAGWPPLDKGPLLRPVIDWMFPYQSYCKTLIRQNGLTGHVFYTGPLPAEAMRRAFLDADLFVLPSYSENSPNSLGEAMLLGLPCVAAAAGGIPDMTRGGAEAVLYGPPGDADALAEAICAVLSRPDHGAAMGQAARQRALITHDPAANAARMTEIYDAVLKAEKESGNVNA